MRMDWLREKWLQDQSKIYWKENYLFKSLKSEKWSAMDLLAAAAI